jgi:exosortase/archaeosortase family protein
VSARALPQGGRRTALRFVLRFAALTLLAVGLLATPLAERAVWGPYLELNARASAALLRVAGEQARVTERTIVSPRAALRIERGCDAIHPAALYAAAVLASPVALVPRLAGLAVGVACLAAINLVRIVSLYYVQVAAPRLFEVAHVEVWQALFIFLAVGLWAGWAVWARSREHRAPSATR